MCYANAINKLTFIDSFVKWCKSWIKILGHFQNGGLKCAISKHIYFSKLKDKLDNLKVCTNLVVDLYGS